MDRSSEEYWKKKQSQHSSLSTKATDLHIFIFILFCGKSNTKGKPKSLTKKDRPTNRSADRLPYKFIASIQILKSHFNHMQINQTKPNRGKNSTKLIAHELVRDNDGGMNRSWLQLLEFDLCPMLLSTNCCDLKQAIALKSNKIKHLSFNYKSMPPHQFMAENAIHLW